VARFRCSFRPYFASEIQFVLLDFSVLPASRTLDWVFLGVAGVVITK